VTTERAAKPIGIKAYGHIGHLPGSRMGPGDHQLNPGQDRIATQRSRDKHDVVTVQEKLDGSCVAVALLDGVLHPLQRAGYPAASSPFEQHHLFADWVWLNEARFRAVLHEGERLVGEWLAMAHGTRYDLTDRDPFVAFDLMTGADRLPVEDFYNRVYVAGFDTPRILATGPTNITAALEALGTYGHYGALDPVEGAVWRVERKGKVDFLAKYVRPDKVDGSYFEGEPVWNWRPEKVA
jgi:hypothetical protein